MLDMVALHSMHEIFCFAVEPKSMITAFAPCSRELCHVLS